jgi:hypothetical protein
MVARLHSISLPEELGDFVDADPDLKLSKITQEAIKMIIKNRNEDPLYLRLTQKIQKLQEELDKR